MERYNRVLGWEDSMLWKCLYYPKQCTHTLQPYQITNSIFHRMGTKNFTVCMETQNIPNSQSILRKFCLFLFRNYSHNPATSPYFRISCPQLCNKAFHCLILTQRCVLQAKPAKESVTNDSQLLSTCSGLLPYLRVKAEVLTMACKALLWLQLPLQP